MRCVYVRTAYSKQLLRRIYFVFKSNLLVKRVFFLLNAAFSMAILDLISRVHLPSFVNMLPKYLKHSTLELSEEICHLGEISINGRILLKWALIEYVLRM